MAWAIAIAAVLALVYLGIGLVFARRAIDPPRRLYKDVLREELDCGNLKDDTLLQLPFQQVSGQSVRGCPLVARLYRPKEKSARYVLFLHGYNYPYISALKYLPLFLERGINVLIPDHAGAGESGGRYATFGYFEQQDAVNWLGRIRGWARDEGFSAAQIGVMGESMGAATALLVAQKAKGLRFCIADCPYPSWMAILRYRARVEIGPWAVGFIPAARLWIYLLSGARVKKVDIAAHAREIGMPAMIIHGEADDYIPWELSHKIVEANPAIAYHLIPGAKHAQSIGQAPKPYREIVWAFLDAIGF